MPLAACSPEHADGRVVGEHRAEQRQRNADAADDDVFPARLERSLLVVEVTSSTDASVVLSIATHMHAEVVGQRHQQHRADEQRRQHVVTAQLRAR